ncbi:MAG: FAD-dependent oxidoreductase, partial [Candidatus Paceibacterota bacterium]
LLKPTFYKFLFELKRFCQEANGALGKNELDGLSLGEFLNSRKFSKQLINDYVLPIGASIWSTPSNEMLRFPARTFLNFFKNHGLLSLKNRPRWQTVVGGSQEYVKIFQKSFLGEIKLNSPVKSVTRGEFGVTLNTKDVESQFDYLIFALHADQVLPIFTNPTSAEQSLFSKWSYNYNHTILHTDLSVMPDNKRAWASWNYHAENSSEGQSLSVTYDMNRLQGLETLERYLVTLSPNHEINPQKIIREYHYYHPLYTSDSLLTQEPIRQLNGQSAIFYCGSYLGYGFHEDAVVSANNLAKHFNVKELV